ncbi:unnamed protein product [Eruca vesicaria subsp. sativa]|uniref:Uncharacterized protein n=1 Tax=Eruca vesicaria subsp. sativa TaxID=29727 RepID=A0ABC8KN36_ERUVS|nr:unnamed protein product [Eruca vesicaria subsp. sativa]
MTNERVGPPPASLSSIEAVKTVTISEEDLAKEKVCAIFKEKFEVVEEGKELKCLHFFEICSWDYESNVDGGGSHHVDDDRSNGFRTRICSLWPLRVMFDWV